MSRHEGVSCDSCLKGNFRGLRYKCLICYDYDLCARCYQRGATTTRHTTEHPMQCILTRADFDLYFAGEALTADQPQAFTCPYCGKMGFPEQALQEHVASDHSEVSFEVVCPVCASLPVGDPNLVTDDFAGHLTLEHRTPTRDLISFLDEPATRHGVRRIPPPSSRGITSSRPRRSNMHFSSSGALASISPSSRENVDPIAELLSQLSGVRRPQGSTPSQLQHLQMQLQLERQQVRMFSKKRCKRLQQIKSFHKGGHSSETDGPRVEKAAQIPDPFHSFLGFSSSTYSFTANTLAARQQLERLPRRTAGTHNLGPIIGSITPANSASFLFSSSDVNLLQPNSSQLLLSRLFERRMSDSELEALEEERAHRSLFVQELVLGTLSKLISVIGEKKFIKHCGLTAFTTSLPLHKGKDVLMYRNSAPKEISVSPQLLPLLPVPPVRLTSRQTESAIQMAQVLTPVSPRRKPVCPIQSETPAPASSH